MSDNDKLEKLEIKRFHGQVRVADVQEAFDLFINRINTLQGIYNDADIKNETDYTLGSSSLAPLGYTLSVGGLKKLLEAYDGVVIGCKPIRIDSTRVKMTAGILITKTKGIELPDSIVNVNSNTKTIYWHKTGQNYVTAESESTIKICDINMNRESIFVPDRDNVQVEDIKGTHKIYTESRTFDKLASSHTPMQLDNSGKPQFYCAIDAVVKEGDGYNRMYLFGEEVAYNVQGDGKKGDQSHKNLHYWTPVNFLYIPKKVSNPYTCSKWDSSKIFEVIEELNVKE